MNRDEIDNVYFLPRDYENREIPLLLAHSDTAQNSGKEKLETIEIEGKISELGLIQDYPDRQLGYDNKCGIAIILWLIAHCPELKIRAVICVQEEGCTQNPDSPLKPEGETIAGRRGGCGVGYALKTREVFFNSSWGLVLDRAEDKSTIEFGGIPRKNKGIRTDESDIIWMYQGKTLCNEQFLKKIHLITQSPPDPITPMRPGSSLAKADAMNIKNNPKTRQICLVNLATCVYNEHELDDYVSIFEVVRTLKVVEKCLKQDTLLSEIAKEQQIALDQ